MPDREHTLRFWGVRGSIATGDDDKVRIGGDTSCIELNTAGGTCLIFDLGTGARALGQKISRENSGPYDLHILLSHTHWDHIMGMPFFAPIHDPEAHLHFYGPKRPGNSLASTLKGLFKEPYFPLTPADLKAKLSFTELDTGRFQLNEEIQIEYSPHPHPNGALSYRIETGQRVIAFITDVEHHIDDLDPGVIKIARDADVLIHDAHFTREDLPEHRTWGHSSWEECAAVARLAAVKKLALFHFSPNYSDDVVSEMERQARQVFPETIAAHQGLTLEFPS